MKFYPKKLNNITDLEREKKRVMAELDRLDKEGFPSAGQLFEKKANTGGKTGEDTILTSLLDFIPASNPLVGILIKIVKRKLIQLNATQKQRTGSGPIAPEGPSLGDKIKTGARAVAIDIVASYLKWKAIELSYKGIRYYLQSRKEKK